MNALVVLLWFGGVIEVNEGEDLKAVLQSAQAGDEIIVHAGTYPTNSKWDLKFAGTEQEPIIVRAGDGEKVIIQGVSNQNIIDIGGTWYTWKGFEMVGGSHGIRKRGRWHLLQPARDDLRGHHHPPNAHPRYGRGWRAR
jgi:hypothetical protein